MTYILLGGVALLAVLAGYQVLGRASQRTRMRWLRYGAGGLAALIGLALLIARRIDIAAFFGAAAFSILRTGKLGPFSFESDDLGQDSISTVRSRYFDMALDHSTGEVQGRIRSGRFAGVELITLGEDDTRLLIEEVKSDPDSLSLLESWLDANRTGWREYFEEKAWDAADASGQSSDPVAEAYAVLGLQPGATDEEVRSAHRELMKGVHPDHGGSSYLASKINEARDVLIKRRR